MADSGLESAYLLLLCLLCLGGNSATLAVAMATGAVRSTNRVFFVAQAIADLLTGCLLCPLAAAARLRPDGAALRAGGWACELAAYAAILLLQLAGYLLLAASCDHFVAFRWPGRYPTILSRTRSACWLAALAGLALLVCLPTVVSHDRAVFSASTSACFVNWGLESSYHLAVCAVVLLPALLAVFATNGYLLTPDFRRERLRYLAFEAERASAVGADAGEAFEDTRECYYRDAFASTAVQLATWVIWGSVQVADARLAGGLPPAAVFFTFWTAVGNCGWRFLVHCACLRDFRLGLRLLGRRLCWCRCRRSGDDDYGRRRGIGGGPDDDVGAATAEFQLPAGWLGHRTTGV